MALTSVGIAHIVVLYLIRSRKLERHKAEEEYKTLSAQLLSIQATVSAKKVLICPRHVALLVSAKQKILFAIYPRCRSSRFDHCLRE